MHLYEVIVRDNYNGKQFLYHVYASGDGDATTKARKAHKEAQNSPCDPIKITKLN